MAAAPVSSDQKPGSRSTLETAGFIDPQTLMTIRNLEMRAKVVVHGFWNGLHRSPYHGFSVEFTEYRQYTPGDDLRYLDWRLFARSDRYHIKKFEDETNLRCYLLVDNSRSMQYGSGQYTKADYANTLAATMAYFLYLQGDAVGLMTFDEEIRDYLPARQRSGHLRHLMLALEKPGTGTGTRLEPPLKRILELVRKRGLMIVITDLLAPIDTLEKHLGNLAVCGHEVLLLHLLDRAETEFDFDQSNFFHDMESGRQLYVDPKLARRDYLRQLNDHTNKVKSMTAALGMSYFHFTTDQPLELALYDFLRERMQRDRKVRRTARGRVTPR